MHNYQHHQYQASQGFNKKKESYKRLGLPKGESMTDLVSAIEITQQARAVASNSALRK